eukprot:s3256_g15.t1
MLPAAVVRAVVANARSFPGRVDSAVVLAAGSLWLGGAMSQNQSLVDVLSQDPGIRTALRRPRRRQPSVAFLHTSSQDAQDEGGLWAYLQSEDLAASAASAAKAPKRPRAREWAHEDGWDVSLFQAEVPDPALRFPFELDPFQKRAVHRVERSETRA